MKITGLKSAIYFYWVKTLSSNTRVFAWLFVLNYLLTVSLNIIGIFEFTWKYFAFFIATSIVIAFFTKVFNANPIDIDIDLSAGIGK